MRARDRQNEIVVAVIVISALALALTFGLVLSLGSRSNDDSDDAATSTTDLGVLVGNRTGTLPPTPTFNLSPTETESPTLEGLDSSITSTSTEPVENSGDETETSGPPITATDDDLPSLTPEPTDTPTEPVEPSETPSPEATNTDTPAPTEEDTDTPLPDPTDTESPSDTPSVTVEDESPTATSRVSVSTLTPTLSVETEIVTLTSRPEVTTQSETATPRSRIELSTEVVTLTPTVEPTTLVPTTTPQSQVELSTEVVTLTLTFTSMPTTISPTMDQPNIEFSTQRVTLTPAQTATPVPSFTPTLIAPTIDDNVLPTSTITPFVVIVVTPTPNTCQPPDDWVPYVVQFGDTLFLIASQAGLQTDTLRQANCIEGDRILAGQTIYIPPGTTIAINTPLPSQPSASASCPDPAIQITYPYAGDVLTDSLIVRGVANGEFFGYYQLQLRPENSIAYHPVFVSDQRVLFENQLGPITLGSSFISGNYILRLEVFNRWGNAVGQCDIPVKIP